MFGHTSEPDIDTYSQIFNAILDKTDNFIITGGEEGLIKIWHRASGSLIANLKGKHVKIYRP
jgi:WD40 repeat protein